MISNINKKAHYSSIALVFILLKLQILIIDIKKSKVNNLFSLIGGDNRSNRRPLNAISLPPN